MTVFLLIAALAMAAPAFAGPEAPGSKTDFTKPFVDDRLTPVRLKAPADPPPVELKAGSGKPYIYDSARKQLPPLQPTITPYSPKKPSK
jgi:hypothetical protein